MNPTQNYALFASAERLHCTVHKLLTGEDGPLLYIEHVLTNTYHLATDRLRKQQERGKGRRR